MGKRSNLTLGNNLNKKLMKKNVVVSEIKPRWFNQRYEDLIEGLKDEKKLEMFNLMDVKGVMRNRLKIYVQKKECWKMFRNKSTLKFIAKVLEMVYETVRKFFKVFVAQFPEYKKNYTHKKRVCV